MNKLKSILNFKLGDTIKNIESGKKIIVPDINRLRNINAPTRSDIELQLVLYFSCKKFGFNIKENKYIKEIEEQKFVRYRMLLIERVKDDE